MASINSPTGSLLLEWCPCLYAADAVCFVGRVQNVDDLLSKSVALQRSDNSVVELYRFALDSWLTHVIYGLEQRNARQL